MVADIRAGGGDSTPSSMIAANGHLYFAANDGTTGSELWRSDGTGAGTARIADINPSGSSNPHNLTLVAGTLFFTADDGTTGNELWKSDGVSTATLVKDINASVGSNPSHLVDLGGILLFSANDGVVGTELWRSDGTGAGTVMVLDIRAGASSSSPGGTGMVNLGGTAYFAANDGTNGRELWRSDGTAAGTFLVKDIETGGSSFPGGDSGLVVVNGTLFFDASDSDHGNELWKSDGTEAGTLLVKDIVAGATDSFPSELANVDGTLFFQACDADGCELWRSDGTAAGTALVQDIQPGAVDSFPSGLTAVAGKLFFNADDGSNGVELWSFSLCSEIDPLLPGCAPADSDAGKCDASLGKLTSKLLASDRKCLAKNSSALFKGSTYEGQACEDVARYRFLGSLSSLALKEPTCIPGCFGSGDIESRANAAEAEVDALAGVIYCDAASATAQGDGFGGYVPTAATQACSDGLAKLAGSLSKAVLTCNARKGAASVTSTTFDLAACQATAVGNFESAAGALTGCASCVQASEVRDAIVTQANTSDSSSAYCRNPLF
jgi:ELWxxDGT repeat protein